MLEESEPKGALFRAPPDMVENIVRDVLPEVARRVAVRPVARLSEDLVDHICNLAGTPGDGALDAVGRVLRGAGFGTTEICDSVIPAAARRFGDRWLDDTLSFAGVTIGVSRLQVMLRELETELAEAPDPNARHVAVVVPQGCQHTLGALALSGALRRQGQIVRLFLCEPNEEVVRQAAQFRPDVVMISAGSSSILNLASETISCLRKNHARATPIVIGGPAVVRHPDLARDVGADLATDLVAEALALAD
ncbi:MAG: cobalamin B12-binding domain-containing protein [Paracoccaceae bacterium]|nr:cobalamin B12-binding domain-containing protein [Paracoccaceae bacterium]